MRPSISPSTLALVGFNPRTRVGCDFTVGGQGFAVGLFQSTHPCGVRLITLAFIAQDDMFQSTHPCGVRLSTSRKMVILNLFQSTHPCGVRQSQCSRPVTHKQFQSTHPCGVRHLARCNGYDRRGFNPRTRVGCDAVQGKSQIIRAVSIHAPVWGATDFRVLSYRAKNVSIHAPVWGATQLRGD